MPPTQVDDLRQAMNNQILALRDKKRGIISEVDSIRNRLSVIQESLDPEDCKPIPSVPELTDEETPERMFDYTRDSLLAFKKEMELQRLAQLKGEEPTGFGAFNKQVRHMHIEMLN